MISNTRYLIDSNVFIQAKNFHYRFEFCEGFWCWLNKGYESGIIYSIDKVRKELKDGNPEDQVRQWAESMPSDFFVDDVKDKQIIKAYAQVMQWVVKNEHYRPQAKDEFARVDKADAFLIAAAKAYEYTIVTHELSDPKSKKRILIPDSANAMQVNCIQIYDLLSLHATGNFTFSL